MSQWNDALNLLKSFDYSGLSKGTDSTAASWEAAREGSQKMEEEEADKKPSMLQKIWDRKTGGTSAGEWVSRTPSNPPAPKLDTPKLQTPKAAAIERSRTGEGPFKPLTARPGVGSRAN